MEKKKSKLNLIPPSYFKHSNKDETLLVAEPTATEQKNDSELESQETQVEVIVEEKKEVATPPKIETETVTKISIQKPKHLVSGLSLKSIREKKEHQIRQMDVHIDEEDLPSDPVDEQKLITLWKDYSSKLQKNGERILGSIMEMEMPNLKGTAICLTYSNNTTKIEIEKAQNPIMSHLRKQLNNYELHLDITVNEEVATKYAFTPQEKYEKLKEKNSNIELLKKTFGLDV